MNEADNIYFIVSIDVEEDMPNWEVEAQTTIRNLEGINKKEGKTEDETQ